MIYVEQVDTVKKCFTDLSLALRELSSSKKDLEEETIKTLREGFSSVFSVLSTEEFKTIGVFSAVSTSCFQEIFGKISDQGKELDAAFKSTKDVFEDSRKAFEGVVQGIKDVEMSDEEFTGDDRVARKIAPAIPGAKKGSPSLLQKESESVKRSLFGAMGKLKIPRFGAIAAGGLMMMAWGYMESKRVQAEAGEVKNIIISAYDSASRSVISKATSSLSALQERLQKFMGISKSEVQGVVSELVSGGLSVEEMMSRVDKSLGLVGRNFVSFTLGMDKMFELSGGTSARRMIDFMRDYGKTMDEAKETLVKMSFAGKESGIGTEQFIKNVTEAAEALKKFGFDIDEVIDLATNLKDAYESIGVPRHLAGREAALGLKELAQGMAKMSDDWMVMIGSKMGYGEGLEARQGFKEAISRVKSPGRDGELYEMTGKIFGIVSEIAKGNEAQMRAIMEDSKGLGLGFKGAQAAYKLGEMASKGVSLQDADRGRNNIRILQGSLATESEKQNKATRERNRWMKGMSFVGQAMLGIAGDLLAWVIAGFRSLIGIVSAGFRGDFDKVAQIYNNFRDFSVLSSKNVEKFKEGARMMGQAAKSMGLDVFGDSIAKALSIKMGGGSSSSSSFGGSAVTQVVMIPVSSSPKEGGRFDFSGGPVSGKEAEAAGHGSDWVGGGLSLVATSVTESGDIKFMLSGNCPRCGLVFGEGGSFDNDYTSMGLEGEGSWTGSDVEAMSRMLQKEMGGYRKSREGEAAGIAHTALSRAKRRGAKPGSIEKVITGGHGWGKQGKKRAYASGAIPTRETIDFARKVLRGTVADPTGGATHFFHAQQGDKFSAGAVPKFAEKGGITTVMPSSGAKKAFFVKPGTADTTEGKSGRDFLTQVSTAPASSKVFSGLQSGGGTDRGVHGSGVSPPTPDKTGGSRFNVPTDALAAVRSGSSGKMYR